MSCTNGGCAKVSLGQSLSTFHNISEKNLFFKAYYNNLLKKKKICSLILHHQICCYGEGQSKSRGQKFKYILQFRHIMYML